MAERRALVVPFSWVSLLRQGGTTFVRNWIKTVALLYGREEGEASFNSLKICMIYIGSSLLITCFAFVN